MSDYILFPDHPRFPCYHCAHWLSSHPGTTVDPETMRAYARGACAHPGCDCDGWAKTYSYKLACNELYDQANDEGKPRDKITMITLALLRR